MGKSLLSMWGLPEPTKGPDRIDAELQSSQTEPDSEGPPLTDVPDIPIRDPAPIKPIHPFFAPRTKQRAHTDELSEPCEKNAAENDPNAPDSRPVSFPVVLKLPSAPKPKVHSFFAPRTKKAKQDPEMINVETPQSSFDPAQSEPRSGPAEPASEPANEPASVPSDQAKPIVSESEKPTFKVCLKAAPEKLRELKPKTHAFFTKRQISMPTKNPREVAPPMPVQPACWPKFHVRGNRLPEPKMYPKRARGHDYDDLTFLGPLLPWAIPSARKKARRLLVTRSEAIEIGEKGLGAEKLAAKQPLLASLLSRVDEKNAFDVGEFEQQLWVLKYAPVTSDTCINARAAIETCKWIKKKIAELRQGPPQPRRRPMYADDLDDFIVDDEEDTRMPDYLILHGPSGTGKTASAYAAAKELGAFIFEVNSSQKRGGKELQSLLDGIGQSHSVHGSRSTADGRPSSPWAPDNKSDQKSKSKTQPVKNRDCVVLIEDIDTLYESEATSFYAALDKLALGSRRPIVVTCQDIERLPYSVTDHARIIFVGPADPVQVVDAAWQIALCEGHSLNKTEVAATAVRYGCDFRKLLNHLQFWSQMGVGGRPSGADWVFKSCEEDKYHRVLSIATPVEPPPLPGTRLAAEPETPDGICDAAETLSQLVSHEGRLPATFTSRLRPEETIAGYLSAEEWCEVEYPERYASEYLRNIPRRSLQPLRYALDGVYDSKSLTADVAPYVRDMARSDLERLKVMQSYNFRRATRRTWASVGVDSRQYASNGRRILELGPSFAN